MEGGAVTSTPELEDALRPSFPGVRVRQRELSGEPSLTWYVYRDRTFPAHSDAFREA
jgi:hypothetical protein